jgi:membrane protein required for colicin V production
MSQFFQHWNILDYVLAAVFLISVILSFFRGFMREIISLVTWFLAFYLALQFSPALSGVLHNVISYPKAAYIVSFIVIFIIVMILGGIAKRMARAIDKIAFLGFFDKILGIVFGVLRGLLFVAIILFIIRLTPMQHSAWVQSSQLAQHFQSAVNYFGSFIPKEIQNLSLKN